MVKDNSVSDGVIKLLEETKHLHAVGDSEYPAIAALVTAIVYSDRSERSFLYAEFMKVAETMGERYRKRRKEIGAALRRYRNLWGDADLDEETCRLLDEEDAAAKPKDIDDEGDPKKKVVN
jgi:hypothetical protein